MKGEQMISSDVLNINGLSIDLLDMLSYRTTLDKSLRNEVGKFDEKALFDDIINASLWYDSLDLTKVLNLDYRVKSISSAIRKYHKYYPKEPARKVFNDLLGCRAICESYEDVLEMTNGCFRLVDMSHGKKNDDGYRGIHLYYSKSNYHYPIEIQFSTVYDRVLNDWLHDYLYKKDYPLSIGQTMRKKYENGDFHTKEDFLEVLNDVLCRG